jgi:hypothetical protein
MFGGVTAGGEVAGFRITKGSIIVAFRIKQNKVRTLGFSSKVIAKLVDTLGKRSTVWHKEPPLVSEM